MIRRRTASLPPHWFQILLALADSERHGLAIMEDVLDRTGGQMRLWPGMLYRNLQRLDQEGLIAEADGPAAPEPGSPRYFRITAAGKRACAAEARRLAAFVAAAREKKLLGKA
jgi:DNA-binding PadR family transcriptional regulator